MKHNAFGTIVKFAFAFFLTVILFAPAEAQNTLQFGSPSREETIKEIGKALSDIQRLIPATTWSQAETQPSFMFEDKINEAIERAMALKDYLANNRYVRVSGVTVGFPLGVSVDFELLDEK